jgi:hypothetical protein
MAIMGSGIATAIFPGSTGGNAASPFIGHSLPEKATSTRRNTDDPPISIDEKSRERIRALMKRLMPEGVLEAEKKARIEAEAKQAREAREYFEHIHQQQMKQAQQQAQHAGMWGTAQGQATWTAAGTTVTIVPNTVFMQYGGGGGGGCTTTISTTAAAPFFVGGNWYSSG